MRQNYERLDSVLDWQYNSFGSTNDCIRTELVFLDHTPYHMHWQNFETFERQLYFGDGDCGPLSTCLGGHTCYTLLVHKGYSCADLKQFECPCYRCYCLAPEGGLYAAYPNTDAAFCKMVRDKRCCGFDFAVHLRFWSAKLLRKNGVNVIVMPRPFVERARVRLS